jgi:F-type H+-transporting ATPase subunit alpha
MKKISGPLRIELAQYRELASFAQFGSDLSKDTLDRLKHGERIVEILKQPQYEPLPVEHQVLLLFLLTNRFFANINVEDVQRASREYLSFLEQQYNEIPKEIRETHVISDELTEKTKTASEEFFKNFT